MTKARIGKYVHSPQRTHEWFTYSFAYFSAADILAKSENGERLTSLLAPIIFTLRHGLELMLKFLAFATETHPDSLRHHDIADLFSVVRTNFTDIDDESITFAATALNVEKELVKQYMIVMTDRVEAITRRYYGYEFLFDGRSVADSKNELFRYPSSSNLGESLDLQSSTLSGQLPELAKDIDDLTKFLLAVASLFAKLPDGRHWLVGLAESEEQAPPPNTR